MTSIRGAIRMKGQEAFNMIALIPRPIIVNAQAQALAGQLKKRKMIVRKGTKVKPTAK